jgi:flavin reductase (DIM6/NTAB) family NADH-FMN oxidoreductase RutF
VAIDPYEHGRPAHLNYKLLISAVVPRPIGFVSTLSADGTRPNLAPFSYFNMVCHDPPLFILGISSGLATPKDTLRHLADTREAVVNMISEPFLEAANATSVDAPADASEWPLSGLTPAWDTQTVRPPRVRDAVFSAECRLESPPREFESRAVHGRKTGCLIVLEATRFWVREDAINDERSLIDPAVLRPVARMGGITYARVTEAVELPRPAWARDVEQEGAENGGYEGLRERWEEKLRADAGGGGSN